MTNERRAAVFLDRDGVLNRSMYRDGVTCPPRSLEDFKLLAGVREAVDRLKDADFVLVVVTNQPDIARGTQSASTVDAMNAVVQRELGVDAILVCPHDDADDCACRKPKPGLLHEAAERFHIDLQRSFMVGDRWRDVAAGRAAGCRTVQVGSLNEGVQSIAPTVRRADLADAATWILSQETGGNDH
ncbi:MAG: HAD family hydrolase [Acidimicrobiales bacterium]|jgi:D-glycero-D-manno-heptose 1,7-bisphosphate phosphatase